MDEIRVVPFSGRRRWGPVAANLALAVLGGLLAVAVLTRVPSDVVVMHVLGWYTVAASLATLVLALALALLRRLPTAERAVFDGGEAWRVRTWPGEWWHALALDAGLVVTATVLVVLGLGRGSSWTPITVVAGLVGLWFLVRLALVALGRRRVEALWLTPDEVVVDGAGGRARVRRTSVQRVRRAEGTTLVRVVTDGPVTRQEAPRPFGPRRRGTRPDDLWVDLPLVGHDLDDLVARCHEELTGRAPMDANGV